MLQTGILSSGSFCHQRRSSYFFAKARCFPKPAHPQFLTQDHVSSFSSASLSSAASTGSSLAETWPDIAPFYPPTVARTTGVAGRFAASNPCCIATPTSSPHPAQSSKPPPMSWPPNDSTWSSRHRFVETPALPPRPPDPTFPTFGHSLPDEAASPVPKPVILP